MSWIDIPYSTLFIFFVNFCIVLAASFILRVIVNVDRFKEQESEVNSYDRALEDAKKRGDKALLRKLKRQEARIKVLSTSVSRNRLNFIMVTILPFSIASFLLGGIYMDREVVKFPFEFVLFNKSSSFYIWYLLTYFTAYLPLSKVLKTSPSFLQDSEMESNRRK